MYQFLYCFDQNYVKQAFTSIISILENVDQNIKFDIITNLSTDEIRVPKKIKNHNYLESISFHKINISNIDLYNLSEAHVTEATFYRLFLQDYIFDKNFITYLDCDVICLSNPLSALDKVYKKMLSDKKHVSFNTEINRGDGYKYFDDLSLKGDKYFNAGVMIFNPTEWRNLNVKGKALSLIPKIREKAIFWDQDILNIIFDNNYFELPDELNSRSREKEMTNLIFHHFSGKYKPWTVKGFDQKHSSDFHQFYKYIYRSRYLITTSNFKNGRKHLGSYLSKKFKFDLKNIIFVYHAIKSLIKKVLN